MSPHFQIGQEYSRHDVYEVLDVPVDKRGGDWDTGYHEYDGEVYIFANMASPGRTGHDYGNYFRGDDLVWSGRTGSRLHHPSIQTILSEDTVVRIFYRTTDRSLWIYHGIGRAIEHRDESPIKVVWSFTSPGERRSEELPEEVAPGPTYPEGATKTIIVNAYERNPAARKSCIAHFGCNCQVCGMSFEKTYGKLGEGYIHVHHIKPLSEIEGAYEVDPVADLIPVCPNCHAMIHKRPHPTVEQLRQIILQPDAD